MIERKDTRFKDSRSSVFSVLYLTVILYLRKLLKGFMQWIHWILFVSLELFFYLEYSELEGTVSESRWLVKGLQNSKQDMVLV